MYRESLEYMNKVQERQEELYKILVSLNNQDPDFTFWLTRGEYRFNRGQDDDGNNLNSGYTNVGIVKLGSHSNLQWAGFHFSDNYSLCELRISTRNDDFVKFVDAAAKIQKELTTQQVQTFCENVIDQIGDVKTNYPFASIEWKDWLIMLYNKFFNIVKTFDKQNNTSFYEILKIDTVTFNRKKENSDKKKVSSNKKEEIANEVDNGTIINDTMFTIPLNQILYGPPGTGKTYHTVEKAIEILEPSLIHEKWEEKKRRFDELKKEGQIVFTTFHQSMSYEDFVEGIKPIPTKEGGITYEVKPGIFKELCSNANRIVSDSRLSEIDFTKTRVFKMSLGEKGKDDEVIFDYCVENEVVALGWGDSKDFSQCNCAEDFKAMDSTWGGKAMEIFKLWMRKGDIVLVADGTKAVKGIAQIIGDYEFIEDTPIEMYQFRKVKWLYKGEPIPISKLYNKNLSQQSIYGFYASSKEGLADYNGGIKTEVINDIITGNVNNDTPKNYVLIIDEINRGNVSQIFGELITLLEEDKRLGNKFELRVRLPYSNDEDFGVPSNLYIIGTMNTADRSVEALDTALRRRFSFVEIMPNPSLLKRDVDGINLQDVLETINKRIIVLKDREHQIGHSYFMSCQTLGDIKDVFKNNIIPLLQEYFYGNYENILLVLGDGFVEEEKEKIVFAGKKTYDGDLNQPRYKLSDIEMMSDDQFRKAIASLLPAASTEGD